MKMGFGSSRRRKDMWEWIHVVLCLAVTVLAVFIFWKSGENKILFPVTFFVAAFMNGANAMSKLAVDEQNKNYPKAALFYGVVGVMFLIIAILALIMVL